MGTLIDLRVWEAAHTRRRPFTMILPWALFPVYAGTLWLLAWAKTVEALCRSE